LSRVIQGVLAAITVLAVLTGVASCGTLETGNVGIRTTLGTVSAEEIQPGIYFGIPAVTRVQEFSAKEIALDLNDLTPKARDNLSLRDLDVTAYYRTAPAAIAELYTKYAAQHGRDEASRIYYPAYQLVTKLARNIIYEETSKLDSLTMHTKREELAAAVQRALQLELDKNDKGVFTVTRVVIRQLTTDPATLSPLKSSWKPPSSASPLPRPRLWSRLKKPKALPKPTRSSTKASPANTCSTRPTWRYKSLPKKAAPAPW
jgi:regulator of protease activity HflC (stomatin/prohibitin superfamily)